VVVDGPVDGRVFVAFVERVLVPSLRPGQVVVLDNLSVHKSARARALVEAAGCQLVFLPPYSPDCNPIEQAFAKSKRALRRLEARSFETVVAAIGQVLPTVTAADAHGFFAAAGFPIP
jgi:transposase